PGVTVRARPEFTIAKVEAAPKGEPKTTVEMLKDARTFSDVPLRAAAFTARAAANGAVNVVVVAEPADPASALSEVSFGLVNSISRRMEVAWPGPAVHASDTRVVSGATVPAGPYRLRVAAISRDGRRGTVDYEFDAALTKSAALTIGD